MYPNPILNNVVLGVPADQPYVVERILPLVPVPAESFDIIDMGEDSNMFEEDDIRALGGESNEIDYGQGKTKGYVVERSLKKILDQREIDEARKLADWFRTGGLPTLVTNPEVRATTFVRDRILKGREVRGARLATTAANYPAGHVTAGGFNAATDDLEAAVDEKRSLIKSKIVGIPQVLLVSWDVWLAVKKNPVIRGRIFGTAGGGVMNQQQVASLLGLDELVVGSSTYTTKVGGAPVHNDIWKQVMILAYVNRSPATPAPSYGYTYYAPYDNGADQQPAPLVPGNGGLPGQTMLGMSFEEPLTERRRAFYYRERYRQQVMRGDAGALWTNVETTAP
jgi:hypothetical protein